MQTLEKERRQPVERDQVKKSLHGQVKMAALRALPMKKVDLRKSGEKRSHDAIVNLVDRALELQRRLGSEKNPIRRDSLIQQFKALDDTLDSTVYRLYEATTDEIAVIEKAIAAQDASKGDERKKSWRPAPKPIGGVKKAALPSEQAKKKAG
jgi:hypothetical protein